MGLASAPSRPTSPSDRTGPGQAHWLRVAREAADDLATDTVTREQAGKAPFDEVSRLREAGLLTFLTPAGPQAGGVDWLTAYAVVREITAADGAIGQLLGCHYFLSRSAAEQWCRGRRFRASGAPPLILVRTSKGLVLDGRQSYTTGVLVADRLAVRAGRTPTPREGKREEGPFRPCRPPGGEESRTAAEAGQPAGEVMRVPEGRRRSGQPSIPRTGVSVRLAASHRSTPAM
jgi:hypothetical protein